MSTFARGSKARLTPRDLERFAGATLFDRIGRAVCRAGCLPRKELYEAWEVARRVRRVFRGGHIVDLAAGHGLLAHLLLLLDDSSPSALAVDPALPASAAKLHEALIEEWPRLDGRVAFDRRAIRDVSLAQDDLVVSVHACGALTDDVIAHAAAAGSRVALLPCCHPVTATGPRALDGWLDGALAIDVLRAVRLEQHGYRVRAQRIPDDITPQNRLLIGEPIAR